MEGREYRSKKFLIILMVIAALILSAVTVFAETDVTGMVKVTYSNAVYDRVRKTTSYDVTLTNTSSETVFAPLIVVVQSITPSSITVANADGMTTDGKPYFSHSSLVAGGKLQSGAISSAKKYIFNNPQRLRFTVQTKIMGVALVPAPTVDDLADNLTEILSTGSTSALREVTIGDQPLQVFSSLDSNGRSLIAASLQERGILLPEGVDLNAVDEVWGRICLEDPDEGLICSPVWLKKDADGNWKVAQW
ncbi:MAG: hypothetical protein D4R73_12155 [Deltaproteobacteria bacterium]|nr:MAG: hypothetical protein D4R73_12155 [Deltaproteobacteria bacterium]